MADWSGMITIAKQAVVLWFIRGFMFVTRARGLRCRSCGLEVSPAAVMVFVDSGCSCGGHKLELVK